MATDAEFKAWQKRQKKALLEAKKAKEAAFKARQKLDRIEDALRKVLNK